MWQATLTRRGVVRLEHYMALIPQSINGKIQFFEAHISDWTTNAVAIGSSAPEVAAIAAKTEAARAALVAQETAQETAKTRTSELRQAVDALLDAGSDLIMKVRAKAATDGDGIYNLANIPPPALPTPKGAPGQCRDFKSVLNADGSVTTKWKCDNPAGATGTVYQLWRQLEGGEFTYIGGSGGKELTDNTIPAGTSSVTYQIQAVRSTAVGPWAQFNVNFGAPNGMVVTQTTPAKLAA